MERIIACDQFICGHPDIAINKVGEDLPQTRELRAVLITTGMRPKEEKARASIAGGKSFQTTACHYPYLKLPELTLK